MLRCLRRRNKGNNFFENGEIEIIKLKNYRRKNIMNKLNGNPYGPSRSEILERKNQELEVKEILKEILNKID
jgi:hypothetical protein